MLMANYKARLYFFPIPHDCLYPDNACNKKRSSNATKGQREGGAAAHGAENALRCVEKLLLLSAYEPDKSKGCKPAPSLALLICMPCVRHVASR